MTLRVVRAALRMATAVAVVAALAAPAKAQDVGFQLNRYEPTTVGSWFFLVEQPWYSSTRWFAGGLTLNYGHSPLRFRTVDGQNVSAIDHQLLGHLDLAGSFLVGSSRVDLQACKLEYSIVSPK